MKPLIYYNQRMDESNVWRGRSRGRDDTAIYTGENRECPRFSLVVQLSDPSWFRHTSKILKYTDNLIMSEFYLIIYLFQYAPAPHCCCCCCCYCTHTDCLASSLFNSLIPYGFLRQHTHTFFAAQITRLGGATPSRSPHDDVRAYVYIILDDF